MLCVKPRSFPQRALQQAIQTSFSRTNRRLYATQPNHPDADVIVVGAGVAGVTASIAAAEKGASVVLLDDAHGGGASALSGGVVYAGGGTSHQRAVGYGDDTPENMFRYLKAETRDAVDEETLRRFCEGSVARIEWLESRGVKFEASLCPHKTSFPTDQHYLIFSGSEKVYPFNQLAKPAPRGHRVVGRGLSGDQLWKPLFRSAINAGVKFLPASKVDRVLVDEDGSARGVQFKSLDESAPTFSRHRTLTSVGKAFQLAVPGIADWFLSRVDRIWNRDAIPMSLKAPAVILAAGGFAFNEDMRNQYLPQYSQVAPLGTRGDDGSGIRLGQSVGGSVDKMDNMSAWRFLYPPAALLEGVIVSQTGRRFICEDIYGAFLTDTMIRDHNGKAYLILDSSQREKALKQLREQTRPEFCIPRLHSLKWDHVKASTLQELATKLALPAAAAAELQNTVASYNDAIAEGKADPMNKDPEFCSPIAKPPFYALDISPRRTGLHVVHGLTLGGLRVDGKTGLVLRGDNTSIGGLYAAGRTAVGICSNGYVSGLSLADSVFAGIRAGEHAAKSSKT